MKIVLHVTLLVVLVCSSRISFSQQTTHYSYSKEKIDGHKRNVLKSDESVMHLQKKDKKKIPFTVNNETYHWLIRKKHRELCKGESVLAIATKKTITIHGNGYTVNHPNYSKYEYLLQGQPVVKGSLVKKEKAYNIETNFSSVPPGDAEVLKVIAGYDAIKVVEQRQDRRVIATVGTTAVVVWVGVLTLAMIMMNQPV